MIICFYSFTNICRIRLDVRQCHLIAYLKPLLTDFLNRKWIKRKGLWPKNALPVRAVSVCLSVCVSFRRQQQVLVHLGDIEFLGAWIIYYLHVRVDIYGLHITNNEWEKGRPQNYKFVSTTIMGMSRARNKTVLSLLFFFLFVVCVNFPAGDILTDLASFIQVDIIINTTRQQLSMFGSDIQKWTWNVLEWQ